MIRLRRTGFAARGGILHAVTPSVAVAAPLDGILEQLPPSMFVTLFDVAMWQFVALGLMVVASVLARFVIRHVVASRVTALARTLGQQWASNLVEVFASPGATLVMAVLLQLGYPVLDLPPHAAVGASLAVRVLFALSVVWAAYKCVDVVGAQMEKRAAETDSKLDDQLVPLIRKSLKIVVAIAGALFILQNLSVDVGSVLAGLGLGGLAFALAAKDTIANFFGSITIFVDRPFQIGDWIVVKGTEGVVEEVGFRSTRVRTFYNSLVSIPNSTFTDAQIDNYGKRQYRRTVTTLGVTYGTTPEQIQAFVEGIRAIIRANAYTRKDYYEVHMSGFGEHSLNIMVYFFFRADSWTQELEQRHNVFLEIMRLAQELGVSFAFPTQTLNVDFIRRQGELPPAATGGELPQMAEVVRAFGPRGERARPAGLEVVQGRMRAAVPLDGD